MNEVTEKIPANIIVAGNTGVGKTTLLNAVFNKEYGETGSGKPITQDIQVFYDEKTPIRVWDTRGFELDPERTRESIEAIKKVIADKAKSKNKADLIHAIWYCISSKSNRYQEKELSFIKELYSTGVPFVIVLTQCDGSEEDVNQFERVIKTMNEENGLDIEIIQVLAKPSKIRGGAVLKPFGLTDLIKHTIKNLPNYVKGSFIAAQNVDKSLKRQKCESIIYDYANEALQGIIDKLWFFNVASTNGKIERMFKDLGSVYVNVFEDDSLDKVIATMKVRNRDDFKYLISPSYKKTAEEIASVLYSLKDSGYLLVCEDILKKNYRAANMICRYGYVLIKAIEEAWDILREKATHDLEKICDVMIASINKQLDEWRNE